MFLFLCCKINGSRGNNFSLHPGPLPTAPSFHFTQLQPFLVKVLLWQKVSAHYFSFVLFGNCVTTSCSVYPEIVALQRKHNGYNTFGLVPNSRDTPVYYVSQEWTIVRAVQYSSVYSKFLWFQEDENILPTQQI